MNNQYKKRMPERCFIRMSVLTVFPNSTRISKTDK